MLKVLVGDIFSSKMDVLVNTVNCVGVMGKGIAKVFKNKYKNMYNDYKKLCDEGAVNIGEPYLYSEEDIFFSVNKILNFPTKKHWRSASRVTDIVNGLDYFIKYYKEWGIDSIAFPPLGCGNGGLEWDVVGKIMYQKLRDLDIDIEIYAPFGTSSAKLTKKFLTEEIADDLSDLRGKKKLNLKDEWLPLVETVYQLQIAPFTSKIGRVMFQKICYVMTELGINTGFNFKHGQYGPYSSDLLEMITILSNSNITSEKQLGKMTQFLINEDEYIEVRKKNAKIIDSYRKKIDLTVNLFSRIKNTAIAEEVTTVFYSMRKLKEESSDISEKELLDYILSWKEHWNVKDKIESIVSTIRNLVVLKWLKITYSKELSGISDI